MIPLAPLLLSLPAPSLDDPVPLPGDLGIGGLPQLQERPSIAAGAGGYLVVWEDDLSRFAVDSDGSRDLRGALLDGAGQVVSPHPILVAGGPWNQRDADVAWNGSAFLVVWESERSTPVKSVDVFGVRVDATGAVLDAAPIPIAAANDLDERDPVVTGDGAGWLVVFDDGAPFTARLSAARVDPAGGVGPRATLVGEARPREFDVVSCQDRFLLSYVLIGGSKLRCRLYDAGLTQLGGDIVPTAAAARRPSSAADGVGFFVSFSASADIRATPIDLAGQVLVPGGTFIGQPVDSAWISAGHDGAQWTVSYVDWKSVRAAHVDAAGNLTRNDVVGDASILDDEAAIAGGASSSVIAWGAWDHQDVLGARYDADGTRHAPVTLSVGFPSQVEPALAGDASVGYLVAFVSHAQERSRVVAQRLDPEGDPLDPEPIELAEVDLAIRRADVAFDGERWLVAWGREKWGGDVGARRVELDGTLPDAAPLDLGPGSGPAVAAVGGTFLVASSAYQPPLWVQELQFVRIASADGAVLDPLPVPLGAGRLGPDVVAFEDRWLVVWEETAQFVLADGTPLPPFPALDVGYGDGQAALPAAGRSADAAVLVWHRYSAPGLPPWADLHARRVLADGTFLDPPAGFVVSDAERWQGRPSIADHGARLVAAWTDHRIHPVFEPGLGDVRVARLDRSGALRDPDGLVVAADPVTPEATTAVAGDRGLAVLASMILDPDYGAWRVEIATLDERVGASYCGPAVPNSTGLPAGIGAAGSVAVADGDLTLMAWDMPPHKAGYFLASATAGFVSQPGGSQGNLCLGGQIARYAKEVASTGPRGRLDLAIDLGSIPLSPPHAVQPGETWRFQAWFRDKNPQHTSNFTDGVAVLFE